MQPLSSFRDNLGTAILLCGGAGSGKTCLSMRLFPKTYVYVSDLNFKSGKDYLEKLGKTSNVVGFDMSGVDETGAVVPVPQRYTRMLKCIGDAHKNPDVDAIVLDSATFVEDIIKAKICGATSEAAIKLVGFEHWGMLILMWKQLILDCRQSGKKLIMTAHEKKEQDESDKIYKYQLAVDGQIRDKFPALFSDVLRCEVVEEQGKHIYKLRTLSNIRHEYLKNTMGLDASITQDAFITKLGGGK